MLTIPRITATMRTSNGTIQSVKMKSSPLVSTRRVRNSLKVVTKGRIMSRMALMIRMRRKIGRLDSSIWPASTRVIASTVGFSATPKLLCLSAASHLRSRSYGNVPQFASARLGALLLRPLLLSCHSSCQAEARQARRRQDEIGYVLRRKDPPASVAFPFSGRQASLYSFDEPSIDQHEPPGAGTARGSPR